MKEWRESKMMKKRWPDAYKIIEVLEGAGFEAFVVGGAVRDYVRGVDANDVDITTNALPHQIQSLFPNTIDVGIEHGTIIVVLDLPIEVTTYRSESSYSDYRRPDQVTFVRSLKEDLKRRDFTINAMALTKEDEIIDFFNGRQDIEKQIIRAVGEPAQRFSEDALRMLRAIRFSSQLGYELDTPTYNAIKELYSLVSHVSMERVKVELEKIWISNYPSKGMNLFIESDLASCFEGQWMSPTKSWDQFNSYGKRKNGWAFFSTLQERKNVENLLSYYKCSNDEKKYVRLVLSAMDELIQGPWSTYDIFYYPIEALNAAQAFSTSGSIYSLDKLHALKAELPIQSIRDLVINGNDLIAWSNKKRGPWIKETMNQLILEVLNKNVSNDIDSIKDWFTHEFRN